MQFLDGIKTKSDCFNSLEGNNTCFSLDQVMCVKILSCISFRANTKYTFIITPVSTIFWKCYFPMNHNVCLSVCRSVKKKIIKICLNISFFPPSPPKTSKKNFGSFDFNFNFFDNFLNMRQICISNLPVIFTLMIFFVTQTSIILF